MSAQQVTFWARARKFGIALVGVLAQLLTLALAQGVIPIEAVPYVSVVLALATSYGVWRVPNARALSVPTSEAH